MEGGVIPVSSISSFIRWVYVRTDLGYACRVEEKKKYLLDGPRIEFLRRLVLPSEDGKRRGLTNRER